MAHKRPILRESAASTGAFIFTSSIVVALLAIWAQATLSDTSTLEQGVQAVLSSDTVSETVIETIAHHVAVSTGVLEEPLLDAFQEAWSGEEADEVRRQVASAIVVLATDGTPETVELDLAEAARPLVRTVLADLGDVGLPTAGPQIDALMVDVGQIPVPLPGEDIPVLSGLRWARSAVVLVTNLALVTAAGAAAVALLADPRRMTRFRQLVVALSGSAFTVAALLWVVSFAASELSPESLVGGALSTVFSRNLAPPVMIGIVAMIVAMMLAATSRRSGPAGSSSAGDFDVWAEPALASPTERTTERAPSRA